MAEQQIQTQPQSAGHTMARPQRWAQPFDANMTDQDVDRLLSESQLKDIDGEKFPKHIPLGGILKNDTRIAKFTPGEIVVREGDYGNSAFLVLSGKLRVVLSPSLPRDAIGRSEENTRSFFAAISQLWTSNWLPETRDTSKYSLDELMAGGSNESTRVVLQDIPTILDKHNTGAIETGALFGELAALGRIPRTATIFADEEGGSNESTRVVLQDIPTILDKHNTGAIETGALFGELAALGRIPRTATIFADEDAELLEIRWQGLRELRAYNGEWKRMIDERYRETALSAHLLESEEFGHLNDDQIKDVAGRCIFETYGSFDWYTSFQRLRSQGKSDEPVIARQGDYPDGLLMVRAGFARQTVKHGNGTKSINYLGAGNNFGLYPLYNAWKNPGAEDLALGSGLSALGYVDVVRVPASVLAEYVFPNIEQPVNTIVAASQKTVAEEALLEWAVDERFINGLQTMVIDLNSCVRCDDCVRACANSHDGNPRFRRHGKIVDNWMVANACMHCADPVCMIGCPTGAIHRSMSGGMVVINDDTCIGCGTCANSCPYENISLVQIADKQGMPVVDEATHRPIMKATKCDLCSDQLGGPACVRACPHDALKRVDFREFAH